jgi:hypothetical protein
MKCVRRSFLLTSVLAAAVLILSACATPMTGVQPGQLQRSEHIAVVSLVGDRAWFGYTGITVFENSELQVPIQEWALDAAVEGSVVAALGKAGAKRVTPLAIDRGAVAKAFRGDRLSDDPAGRFSEDRVKEPLLRAAAQISADTLILVVPTFNPPVNHRSETLRGVSVVAGGAPFGDRPRVIRVFLSASVLAVDVKTGQVMGRRTVYTDPEASSWNGVRPNVPLDPAQWQRGFTTAPTSAQLQVVRNAIEALVPAPASTVVRLLDPGAR